ncbi:hypothetical protein I6N90_07595 [Paenibacillus sp. GSMTC-2017]|nr:hypothetical protein [Paenibacillus sp. GSMTC-2017]
MNLSGDIKGGEVHCLKYGSFFKEHIRLFETMKAEEAFIKQTNKSLRIWIDLYDTKITREVLVELVESLNRIGKHIHKLTIVGLNFRTKWMLNSLIKKHDYHYLSIAYFVDPEDAKTWLVNEK